MRLPSISADLSSITPHFQRCIYLAAPKVFPELFLYILDTPDSFLMSVATEIVAFRGFDWNRRRACAIQISHIFYHNRIFL